MKICAVILVALIAAAHAFFMPNSGTQAAPQQSSPMGDPMQMQWLRQMLMTILPKILSNPALVQAFTGKPADAAGSAPAMPPANNIFNPQPPPPPAMGMGAPAGPGGFMPTNDRFKDMRIIELLQDPSIGLVNDPNVAHYIPPPGAMHFGFSLPDRAKDYIQTAVYQNAMRRRGQLSPLENELIHLIGDPIDVYHPAAGYRPGGMGGPGMAPAAQPAYQVEYQQPPPYHNNHANAWQHEPQQQQQQQYQPQQPYNSYQYQG